MAHTPGRKSPFKSRTKVGTGHDDPGPELLQECDQLMQQCIFDPVFNMADEQWEPILEYFLNNFSINHEDDENTENTDVSASCKKFFPEKEISSDNIAGNEGQKLVPQEPKLVSALQCTVCWKVLKSRQGLRMHRKSHGVAQYFCGIDGCMEAYDDKVSLGNHEHLQHCTCKFCGQKLGNRTGLKLHEQSVHSESSKTEISTTSDAKPPEKRSSRSQEPDAAKVNSFEVILCSSIELPPQEADLSLAISAVALAYFSSYGAKKITLQNLDAIISSGRLHLKICTAKFSGSNVDQELTLKHFGESITSDKPALNARLLSEREHERRGNLLGKSSAEILQKLVNQYNSTLLSVQEDMYFVIISASDHPGFYLLDPNRVSDNSISPSLNCDCKKARVIKFSKTGMPELISYLKAIAGGNNADRMNFSIVPVRVL